MEFQIGQMVYSKDGHDKGEMMLVHSLEGSFVYVVDGKRRTLDKPKKKNPKHLQPTHYVDAEVAKCLVEKEYLLDATIRKTIKMYKEKAVDKGGS